MMKKVFLLFLLSIAVAGAEEKVESIRSTDVTSLYEQVKKESEKLWLLDIREPDQIGHGEIFHLNSVTITRGYLEFKIEKAITDKRANIVIYCCTGKRGKLAVKTLNEMGYTNASYLKGGIRKWVESGYPLDTVYGELVLKK